MGMRKQPGATKMENNFRVVFAACYLFELIDFGCGCCGGTRLRAGKEVTVRRVVPVLGVPDALVPINLPSRVGLLPGWGSNRLPFDILPFSSYRSSYRFHIGSHMLDGIVLMLGLKFAQCRETSALWVSIDVPVAQPPGVYTGEISLTAVRPVTE